MAFSIPTPSPEAAVGNARVAIEASKLKGSHTPAAAKQRKFNSGE